jgi:prepilin-type N-terminal cleavage/methylation domain-containing protein
MRRLCNALVGRCRDQAGFTLIELLVTLIMLLVVLGAATTVLVGVNRAAPNDVEREHVVGQTEAAISKMIRELRNGYAPSGTALPTTSGEVLDVLVPNPASSGNYMRVKYDCSVASTAYTGKYSCMRYWSTTLTSSPSSNSSIVIDNVANDENSLDTTYAPVFVPNSSTSPLFYTVTIKVPAQGSRTASTIGTYTYNVTLTDGLYLRNAGPTNRANGGQ